MTNQVQKRMTIAPTTAHPLERQTVHSIRGFPLIGNLLEYAANRPKFLRRMASIGDICGMHFGAFPIVLFNQPEHVQSIFVDHAYDFDRGIGPDHILHTVLGENILFCGEGDAHRNQRKLMSPPFQPRHIANYAAMMGYYGEHIQHSWTDGSTININQQMNSLTMSIIGKVLFDADVFTKADKLGAAVTTIVDYVSYTTSTPIHPPYHWPLPRHRRTRKALETAQSHIQRFIDERRGTTMERNDLLSILLQAKDTQGRPMSDRRLIAECLTLFFAGYETMATVLTWTWYLLCLHPQIYQGVQREVDSTLKGQTPTYADLAHLPYCLRVLKEVMRLYPPVPVLYKRALCDVEINGYHIPKGQGVLVAPYTLHRREEYFPQPERFDPERFTTEREKQLPRHLYLPFGAGPHVCLGNYFAMMEGHLLLATLAQRVTFELPPGMTAKPMTHSLLLQPSRAMFSTIRKR